MKKIISHIISLWMFFALLTLPFDDVIAQNIRIIGKVITNTDHKPVPDVMLVDAKLGIFLTETAEDGTFQVTCDPNTTISFQSIDIETTNVEVAGRTKFTVEVTPVAIVLEEVPVVTKGKYIDSIRIEPGDILQMGDKFFLNAVMKIGKSTFRTDQRFVAQAILYNYTKKNAILMPPLVIDGKHYGRTQRRMYDRLCQKDNLVKSGDPIGDFEQYLNTDFIVGQGDYRSYKILYKDSVTTEVGKKDFIRCDIVFTIEDYKRVRKHVVQNYVEGVINPLRFLKLSIAGSVVTDSAYYPKPELQMCETKGQIDLKFSIGKKTLDMNNSQNKHEFNKLKQQLNAITNAQGAYIKSFRIIGTASPDGNYNSNLHLAEGRMASAQKMIKDILGPEFSTKIYSSTNATVAPWENIVSMLRKDSLFNEANEIAAIIEKYPKHDTQSMRIRKLPFYNLLSNNYLPKLRKVEYEISYDIRRVLTISEIEDLYRQDPNNLTQYEYFKLFRTSTDEKKKERYCIDALQVHPKFWMAANELQALYIKQKRSDDKLLAEFAKSRVHPSVLSNHIIALLEANRYTAADTLSSYLPRTPQNKMLLALVGVHNNRIKANHETIESSSIHNKVLMFLYMNRNQEAYEACKEMDQSEAFTHFLYATCYKRMNDEDSALKALKKAFELDPSLEQDAKIDGDLHKLYEKIKRKKLVHKK